MRLISGEYFIDLPEEEAWRMLYSSIGAYLDGNDVFVLVDPDKNELDFPIMNFITTIMELLLDEKHKRSFFEDGGEIVH